MNGYLEPTQPLRVFCTLPSSNFVALACLTCCAVTIFSSAIRLITKSRRSLAASGAETGLTRLGFCTRPASIAAWASVSLSAVVEK